MAFPAYMLVKLKHDIGIDVHLPGLSPFVVGIEPSSTTYYGDDGKIANDTPVSSGLGLCYYGFQRPIANIFKRYCRYKAARWERKESGSLALRSTLVS
jgi:hypothetical protein